MVFLLGSERGGACLYHLPPHPHAVSSKGSGQGGSEGLKGDTLQQQRPTKVTAVTPAVGCFSVLSAATLLSTPAT